MKLISFNCTIEVSKDENGYSNNYYVDVTDKGVSISHPYVTQTPDQVMFVTQFVHDFIGVALGFNAKIDGFNRDMKLEQYAPKVVKTEEPVPETTEESAESQVARGGSEEVSTGADGDIDASKSTIVITKVTEEDDW